MTNVFFQTLKDTLRRKLPPRFLPERNGFILLVARNRKIMSIVRSANRLPHGYYGLCIYINTHIRWMLSLLEFLRNAFFRIVARHNPDSTQHHFVDKLSFPSDVLRPLRLSPYIGEKIAGTLEPSVMALVRSTAILPPEWQRNRDEINFMRKKSLQLISKLVSSCWYQSRLWNIIQPSIFVFRPPFPLSCRPLKRQTGQCFQAKMNTDRFWSEEFVPIYALSQKLSETTFTVELGRKTNLIVRVLRQAFHQ